MSDDIVNLNERRAVKASDCRQWSAQDLAETLLADIKSGKIKPAQIVVHYFEPLPQGGAVHHNYAAGVTFPEHIALLHVALDRLLKQWIVS